MSIQHIIYLALIGITLTLAFFANRKAYPPLSVFCILLSLSLFTELTVDLLDHVLHKEYYFVYHIYIPAEGFLLLYFLGRLVPDTKIARIARYAAYTFVPASLLFSFFFYRFTSFPSVNFNAEGILLIGLSIPVLFNLDPNRELKLYQLPYFWIILGMLTFYPGVFFLNVFYNYLLEMNSQNARKINDYVNLSLNYLLYIFWITGLLWTLRKKRSY